MSQLAAQNRRYRSSNISNTFAFLVKHNMYVESVVPKEDLLIWNVKDGWEPLCSFLGKEIPDEPIPHDNKTGDIEFLRNYGYKHKMYALGMNVLLKNLLFFVIKVGLGFYLLLTVIKQQA